MTVMRSISAFYPGLLITSLGLGLLISLPLFSRGKHVRAELYQDEDGTTKHDVQAAFERKSRTYTIILLLFNAAGFASNTAAAVLMSADAKDIPDRLRLLLVALKICAAVSKLPLLREDLNDEFRLSYFFKPSLLQLLRRPSTDKHKPSSLESAACWSMVQTCGMTHDTS